ncbi:MAG: hypothetical protein EPO08_21130 [Rhodospirillaceae bacterium]|nr:MAG: hypothetical protein EPO08_21130 [Rhodospirillaceae bacterium]
MTKRSPLHPKGSMRYVAHHVPGSHSTIGQIVEIIEARDTGKGEFRYRAAGAWFYEDDLSTVDPLVGLRS